MNYWSLNDLIMAIDDRDSLKKPDLIFALYQAKLHLERMDKRLSLLAPFEEAVRGIIEDCERG